MNHPNLLAYRHFYTISDIQKKPLKNSHSGTYLKYATEPDSGDLISQPKLFVH